MARPRGPDIKTRLIEKAEEDENGCLIFNGATRQGYGVIWKNGRHVLAHRESYRLFCGELGAEEVVCHKCDVRNCIKPEHLFKGDRADNNRDMKEKLRHAFGEKNGHSKFSEDDVAFIKSSEETNTQLAAFFGVNQSTISRIRSGKRWTHTMS